MGTWDIGPFDNDDAADFSGKLDAMPEHDRVAAIREALRDAAECDGYLDSDIGAPAIAAAALVARDLVDAARFASPYGPKQPLPPLPPGLKPLAVAAIDRTLAADSELAALWGEGGGESHWHRATRELRTALAGE